MKSNFDFLIAFLTNRYLLKMNKIKLKQPALVVRYEFS